MTTRTENLYPRLPELAPQAPTETREQYGLRAFRFVLATETTATVDTDALELASHVYRVAIANRDLLPASIDRLAEVDRAIRSALRRRQAACALDNAPDQAKTAPGCPRNDDRPNLGPMAPLSPTPRPQPPLSTFGRPTATPVLTRQDFDF